MVNWRALFCRPPKTTAASHPPRSTPQLVPTAATSQAGRTPVVLPTTRTANLQRSSSQVKTQNASNNASTTVGNGLKLALGLLKESVTGIGVPGLEAAVSGVVKVIEIIENVHDNEKDLSSLSRRISGVAQAISKAPNLHPKDEVPEALTLRLEEFLQELQVLLDKVQAILGERNLLLRTANSQANKDAITDVNTGIDRLISQFSAEGIISIELNVAGARRDIHSVGRKVDEKVDGVGQKVDGVNEKVVVSIKGWMMLKMPKLCKYEALIERIPRVHARYHDTSTKPSRPCHQGTRIGLLQGINEWIQGPSEDATSEDVTSEDGPKDTAYLWLCGEVGVGKTTVAHTIAKEQDTLRQLGASFFFSRHDRDRQSPRLLFPSIAYQLARFDRGIWRALAEVLKPDPDIVNRGLTEQFTKLVLEPLSRSGMATSRTVVIVIDGLDECSDPASVLDALAIGIEAVSVRLRVLVCSRPYAAIQSKFKNTPLYHLASQNHFHDINPKTLSSDVAAFLTWSLGGIASRPANSHLPAPWPPEDQLNELIIRAAGLFIIASTYVKPVVGSSPLAELDALYDQVLDDLKRSLKTTAALVFAREIIETVILAEARMSLDGLAGLFSVKPSDARSVFRRLTAVILLPESQIEAITPFHASFGEYIQDDARCTIRELSVDTSLAHGRIADRCIATMVSAARNGIIGVEPFQSSSLRYASEYLVAHVRASHDPVAGKDRKAAMESGIWTWLNLMYTDGHSLEDIRSKVKDAGFTGLLHIKGVDADAETDVSIARLMIANHALATNVTSDDSLRSGAPMAKSVELAAGARVPRGTQLVKFVIPDDDELSRACEVLDIIRDARLWNKHGYSDLFIQGIMVDVNSPTEVQLLVSSSISFRGAYSLSDYLKKMERLDITSRIRLSLKIAKTICNLNDISSLPTRGFLESDFISVSPEGNPVLQPRTWILAGPLETPDNVASFDCKMTRSNNGVPEGRWYQPELIPDSSRKQLLADIWDFGSLLFRIVTGMQPRARYKHLAEGRPDLGYVEHKKKVPDNYFAGRPEDHGHQTRYERAVSLLINTIEGCEEVKTVLKACWMFRPQDRPSMREVVEQLEAILTSRGER